MGDLRAEIARTRRVLERLPEEHWDWKPHEKSFSLGDLAIHIANLPLWLDSILREDEFNLADTSFENSVPPTRDAILARFDSRSEAVRQALDELTDDRVSDTYTLRNGDQVISQLPRYSAVRAMGISHLVHHRAQMTVYLRLLDVPLPAIYGPSADEANPPD